VLDPAMGSGHFLVDAVDFITDRLIDFLNRFPRNPIYTALAKMRDSIVRAVEEQGVSIDPFDDRLNDVHLLKRHVLIDISGATSMRVRVRSWTTATASRK
jgi:hypothetical protein